MLLLTQTTEGLRTAELAVGLSDAEQASVTIRAEISRLRGMLEMRLESRPYRISPRPTTDLDEVRGALRAGDIRRAVTGYVGPVLPDSTAPAVVELRDDLHDQLRSTLLAADDPDAVLGFADTNHGRDDYPVWAHGLELLAAGSPRRPQVAAHLARLDTELA